jgi:glycosyltransferase involved in cell wall biosynthesis
MTPPSHQSSHVAQIGFFNDPAGRAPSELLESWATIGDVAEAASRCGVRVSVVQACTHSARLERNGVRYYFLPFATESGSPGMTPLVELLRTLAPDVLHVHGLGFHRQVASLATLVPDAPIILQDHASRPPRLWRRAAWRRALSFAAGIAFCAAEQARPFASAGLLSPHTRVYAIPESTTRFVPGDRQQARVTTGLRGDPALLWVGHLDANKDPLTVLDGVSAAARALPGLQLWCCFGVAPLLRPVRDRIAADPCLRDRVQLLGRVPHERVEQLMLAADIFVLGSHREGSGYSLIEALGCGLPPAVTDIPSFRALTGAGTVGRLWPCGNSQALSRVLQSLAARRGDDMRAAVRAHFERELSFAALGAKLTAMYQDVIECARGAALAAGQAAQRAAMQSS